MNMKRRFRMLKISLFERHQLHVYDRNAAVSRNRAYSENGFLADIENLSNKLLRQKASELMFGRVSKASRRVIEVSRLGHKRVQAPRFNYSQSIR